MSIGPTALYQPCFEPLLLWVAPLMTLLDGSQQAYSPTHGYGSGMGAAATVTVAATAYKSDRVTALAGSLSVTWNATAARWEVQLSGSYFQRSPLGLASAEPVYVLKTLTDSSDTLRPTAPQMGWDWLVFPQ